MNRNFTARWARPRLRTSTVRRFAAGLLAAWLALGGSLAPSRAVEPPDDQYALGAGHYSRGRWELAAEAFASFCQAYPDHAKAPRALFFLGEAEVQAGKLPAAREHFAQFLAKYPDDPLARQAQFRAAEAAYLTHDWAAAQAQLEAFSARYPDDDLNAYVLVYLGEAAWETGAVDRSAQWFERALAKYPAGRLAADARLGLARAQVRQGSADQARDAFEALAADEKSPLAAEALWQLGSLDYGAQRYEAALGHFERLVRAYPSSSFVPRARLGEGWCLFQLRRFTEAEARFRPLVDDAQSAADARYWLGLTLLGQQRWGEALEELSAAEKALASADPPVSWRASAVFHRGTALRRLDRGAEAAQAWQQLVDQWPADAWADDALVSLAEWSLEQRDYAAVERWLDGLAERSSETAATGGAGAFPAADPAVRLAAVRLRARSLVEQQRYADAVPLLDQLLQETSDPTALAGDRYLKGLVLQKLGQAQAALDLLETPAGTGVAAPESALLRATALVELRRDGEAAEQLEGYLKQFPDSPSAATAWAQLALCRARLGDRAGAEAAYGELCAKFPQNEALLPTTAHLAELAFTAQWWDWSEPLFTRLIDQPGDSALVARGYSGRGWSRWKLGQREGAAEDFAALVANYPEHPRVAEALLACGRLAEERGDWTTALGHYGTLIAKYPQGAEVPAALLAAARVNEQQGDPAAAEEAYAQLAEKFADQVEIDAVQYEWSWVLLELGRADESTELLRRLCQEHPQSRYRADATYRLAERALAAGRLDEARALAEPLIAESTDPALLPYLLYLSGQLSAAEQNWTAIEAPLERLLREFADHPLALPSQYWLAEADYRLGNLEAAGERLARLAPLMAGRQEGWAAQVLLRRAQVLAHANQFAEARQVAGAIPEKFPQFEQLYEVDYLIGRCLAAEGEFAEARDAYRRVCRSAAGAKTETAARAQLMIGETFFFEENYAAALREYLAVEILYAFTDLQATALLQAGKCYEQLGEWKQAAELYTRLESDFPAADVTAEAQRRRESAQQQLSAQRS